MAHFLVIKPWQYAQTALSIFLDENPPLLNRLFSGTLCIYTPAHLSPGTMLASKVLHCFQ